MNHEKVENLPLAYTARWTASARSKESLRDDRLFYDPWAAALAGVEGANWIAQQSGGDSLMVIRTCYFDDFLQDAVVQRGMRQVVIMAAGLDTRAYRLPWPDQTLLYEIDQDIVLNYKAEVLGAAGAQLACERISVAGDLTGPWLARLLEAGFDATKPAAWLLEGILFYLPNEEIARILGEISILAAQGSRLGFDIINSLTLTSPHIKTWIEMQAKAGAPWIGSLDDPESFLQELGWQAMMTQPGAPDAHFNRWTLPIIPVKMPNMPHQWYVTASKMNA